MGLGIPNLGLAGGRKEPPGDFKAIKNRSSFFISFFEMGMAYL